MEEVEASLQSALGKLLDNRFNCRFVVYILLWRILYRICYAFPWPPLQHSHSDRKGVARFGNVRCVFRCVASLFVAEMWSILSLIFLFMSCASNATAAATLREPNDRSSSSTFTSTPAVKQLPRLYRLYMVYVIWHLLTD